jgi:4-aminobutyrate aminotransferase-like enzyme/Ser/Thr protein kinase RdoA (MazF antagonist)
MEPALTPDADILKGFLGSNYRISGSIQELPGYQDLNYLIFDVSGEKYILKISTMPDDRDFIRSQNRILAALSARPVGRLLPCPVSTASGELTAEILQGGNLYLARLFPFIEGAFLAETKIGLTAFFELGRAFGQLDREMIGLEDPVLKCRTHEWELGRVLEFSEDINLIPDAADRRLVHYFIMKYREEVLPVYHKLPRCLIHGDGNDWNILVRAESAEGSERIAGIIDFGDMVWGPRVNEVAIVLAYAMMGREDFGEVYNEVIRGYSDILPLTAEELSVLHYLTAARWCQTMVMAARQEKLNPGSAYHQVSTGGARKMLHSWIRKNPEERVKDVESTERRYRYFSKAVSLSYRKPIHMTGAAMQYMYGADGRTYLDCVNNIPHVGHCHPKVVEAGQRQMARLNTNTRYLYGSLDRYAGKLLSKFPASLSKVFFVNSGSAATDLAVRLAEAYTGRCDYLVLDNAYHGNTKAAIGLSPYKFDHKGGQGKPDNVSILSVGKRMVETDNYYVETDNYLSLRRTFFAESIVGCAGQIVLPKEFMQQTVAGVRETGGLYVADEVQTGFGRVGHHFWGFELYGVVPDIVILGKPMGNGHPMGAVVCTGAVAKSFETGMEFFSSFGGNPVSCEIGLAVLEVIEEEGLQENARLVGDYLLEQLSNVVGTHNCVHLCNDRKPAVGSGRYHVAEVRGSGLFLGIELTEPESGKPATEAAVELVNDMKEKGFLLSTDGPFNNVIKFKPPMCFSMENAEELVRALS